MHPLVRLVLVQLQVAGGVKSDDAAVAPIGMDAQRDLLDHRAAGHEHGRRLIEQRANLLLEDPDRPALAVDVEPPARPR